MERTEKGMQRMMLKVVERKMAEKEEARKEKSL